MARPREFRSRVRAREALCGAFCSIASADAVELAAYAGFDFCVVDAEHGAISIGDILSMVRAGHGLDMPMLVRVPQPTVDFVFRSLDAGADGIIVPQAEDARTVEAAIAGARYPPLGTRGLAFYGRAHRYGMEPDIAAVEAANEHVVTGVLLESKSGIDNASAIMATEGLDLVLVGTTDLSASLGFGPGTAREVDEAISKVAQIGRERGLAAALPIDSPATAARYLDQGVSIFVTGLMPHFLRASRDFVSSCREVQGRSSFG